MTKVKEKMTLHPVMTFLILTGVVMIISGVLNLLEFEQVTYSVNQTTLEYTTDIVSVENVFSLSGLKYIFSSTVSNFVNFAPLSSLIIILIEFGVMEKSGFLKTAITFLAKKMKKNTVTFIIVFLSVIASLMGDISYIVMIPLSAAVFKYGKRNPLIGIIAAFAGLTCGEGVSMIFTSVDSSLLSQSLLSARVIDLSYRMASISGIFIMGVAVLILSFVITWITENVIAKKFSNQIDNEEEFEDKVLTRKELRGLLFAIFGASVYFLIILYNIIPGLPFSGNLLDNTQILYVDKLFSYNSFFSNGFVFVVTIFFLILGLFYGLGSRTIKNNKDFVDALGYSLDGIGKTLVLILAASLFVSVVKYSNIGTVIVAYLASIFRVINFEGLPLIILLFIISAIATLFLPASISKWSIISPIAIPVFMNAGITPEFAQIIFRFGESVTMGLTPVMAYFVIYLAFLNKNSHEEKPIGLFKAIKYQVPYATISAIVFLILIVLWYIIGLPLGINGGTVL